MPVNAQIPLMMEQFQPATAQLNAQSYQQHMQDAQLKQQEIAVGQQNMRNQMFLSQVASEPGSLDPKTGLWSQDAIDKIVKGNPILGRDILQKQTKDKMTLETLALDQGKVQLESHKVKSEAINDEQMQAIAAADVAPADQREQVYAKEWTAGRDRLSKSGIFSADTQFGDMSYRQAKEIALRRTSKENKNPVQQVEDARDQVNDLKTEYTHMDANSPQAKQLLQKIADGEAAIKRMTAPTAPMVKISGGGEGGMQSTIPVKDQELSGDDFLKTLPPAQRSEVKALAEGRLPISPYALRSKQMWPLIERTMQYDPNFDASNYQTRVGVRKDFTSGPTSKNLTGINTAIGHIGTLDELGDALNNNDVKKANSLLNTISIETGNQSVNNFNLARSAVGDELMRTFRQVGASETEANAWKSHFDAANSPEQMKGATKVAVELLNSRINALNDTWKRGMNTDKDFPNIVSSKSKSVLKRMGIQLEAGQSQPEKTEQTAAPTAKADHGAALEWANAHPDDPRAAKIKERASAKP